MVLIMIVASAITYNTVKGFVCSCLFAGMFSMVCRGRGPCSTSCRMAIQGLVYLMDLVVFKFHLLRKIRFNE